MRGIHQSPVDSPHEGQWRGGSMFAFDLRLNKRLNKKWIYRWHYCDVIMSPTASQITSVTIVYSIVYSGTDQRKHQSSASLAFVRGIHRRPVNSPHKWPVTRKMFPFDDVIMIWDAMMSMWDHCSVVSHTIMVRVIWASDACYHTHSSLSGSLYRHPASRTGSPARSVKDRFMNKARPILRAAVLRIGRILTYSLRAKLSSPQDWASVHWTRWAYAVADRLLNVTKEC